MGQDVVESSIHALHCSVVVSGGLLSDHVLVTLIRSEVQPASIVKPINPLHVCGCHPIMHGTETKNSVEYINP